MAEDRFERRWAEESAATRGVIAALRQDVAVLREQMASKQDLVVVREQMANKQDLAMLRDEVASGFVRLDRQIADAPVDMIKWTFAFWTGQCFVILGFLFLFLRNH
jgi:hypothetical protein